MHIAEYIQEFEPMDINTPRQACIDTMLDMMCMQLPVWKESEIYGVVELDELLHSQEDTIESVVEPGYLSIHQNSHVYEALDALQIANASICCVLNENKQWVGLLTKDSLLKAMSDTLTINQNGAVVVVEMAAHQYSSSEICRIIESEGAQMLGMWLENVPNSGRIRANIKLNTNNAERIISGLRRYNYDVMYSYGDDDYKEIVERRFQSLMKYIDL